MYMWETVIFFDFILCHFIPWHTGVPAISITVGPFSPHSAFTLGYGGALLGTGEGMGPPLLSDGFARTKRNWRWNPFCVVGRVLGGVLCSGISLSPYFYLGNCSVCTLKKKSTTTVALPRNWPWKCFFFRENCRLPVAILFFIFVWARFFLNDALVNFLLSS